MKTKSIALPVLLFKAVTLTLIIIAAFVYHA